jgi:hypothetical protein
VLVSVKLSSASKDTVEVVTTAEAGTDVRKPAESERTTPKANLLKNVDFDITFLSIVVKETFSITAGKGRTFAS